MRSKSEFKYEDDYKEYLRHYYAGQICASLNARGEYGYSDYKGNAQYSVEQADWLIDALYNTTVNSSLPPVV